MNYVITDVNDLKITSLKQGQAMLNAVNEQIKDKLKEMQGASIETHRMLSDERYELVKARRKIQSEMARLFKERHNAR